MQGSRLRTIGILPLLLTLVGSFSTAQQPPLSGWTKLINGKKCEEAQRLCTSFADSSLMAEKVEAQKCLANAALCGHDIVQLQGDDAGGGTLGGGYESEAVDKALQHLNLGIQLAPQDATIHEGRLHVLEVAARYTDMVKALDESCSIYKGRDAPGLWLDYSPELMDLRQYDVGLEFMMVLDKHYPNSPDILGNIGAFLDLLKRDSEAIPYLQRAVALAPNDPINAWDLGRAYDYAEQINLADQWYQKALPLEKEPKQLAQMSCIYAHFIADKLHDRKRSCAMEKHNCAADDRASCGTAPVTPTHAP